MCDDLLGGVSDHILEKELDKRRGPFVNSAIKARFFVGMAGSQEGKNISAHNDMNQRMYLTENEPIAPIAHDAKFAQIKPKTDDV